WLVASILFYVIVYVGVVLRDKQVQKVHSELVGFIFLVSKEKIIHANRKIIVLMFAEIVFIFTLAFSIYLYLDPEININYSDGTPIPFEYKIVAFIIVLIFGYFIFSTTKDFRQKTYGRSKLQKKLFKEEGPHAINRKTKKKSKIIRIRKKQ
ncbi:MAG TPA: hypothetical protein PKK60_00005, partial [archaeon]|nr:hypothetical protein [archaeon]